MPLIRSVSGLRATLADSLTPAVVADYGAAFASLLPEGNIVVGRDGRPSGAWIEHIIIGALQACGRSVVSLGIVPTPTVQLYAEQPENAGGISITASHNPAEWNGLKFINGRGIFLNKTENAALWSSVDSGSFALSAEQQSGNLEVIRHAAQEHIQALLKLPLFADDNAQLLKTLRKRRLRAVVDAVNCSGSDIVPAALEALGCESIPLFCDGSGVFPHKPEPLPENLTALGAAVVEHDADIGIAVDPDADRLVLIDERGMPIGEENTIVLAALAALKNKSAFGFTDAIMPIVANLSTTRALEDIAAQYGGSVHRSAVGEINVVEMMLKHNAPIGGEGSGGVIAPACHAGRDSLVGIALVTALLAQEGRALSELVATLPRYSIAKLKRPVHGDLETFFDTLAAEFASRNPDRTDGLKINLERASVHLRASNTEPIVRIIAEAETREQAAELASSFADRMN